MECFRIDESGYTGFHLLNVDQRFQGALAIKDFDVDDVAAARRYVAAYVTFFKYAEGEDHEGHGHEGHGHEH